jgi:hypothetical protein
MPTGSDEPTEMLRRAAQAVGARQWQWARAAAWVRVAVGVQPCRSARAEEVRPW